MRRLTWCVFQLALMYVIFSFYVDDPRIDMKKMGGQVAFASFVMSGIATMILIWLYDLWMRFYNWAQHPPEVGARDLWVRFRARRLDRRLRRLAGKQGADHVRLARTAARAGGDLPKQIG